MHLKEFEERCWVLKQQPFFDPQLRVGDPDCSWSTFRRPLLRACNLSREITWEEKMDAFWDNTAPDGTSYWAVQKESQNAALLQMIGASIEASTEPIHLKPDPKTFKDAVYNLQEFSDEGRQEQRFRHRPDAIAISSVPRFRKCFGWMNISGKELYSLDPRLRPHTVRIDRRSFRDLRADEEYYAILYEYISQNEDSETKSVMEDQLNLLWLAGFTMVATKPENWVGGILLDMADPVCPWQPGWFECWYLRFKAEELMGPDSE
ncbi:hypothetical protein PT974_09469 [Cladobotryum mycophilum]|uniref:Uncharacterized protein n=1 Tax=Cladobotryum mycophilum TaxID=491253 RepID=A0ABR0SHM0_9HYPO